jgi:dipeptidyl aminopeptidase/acylaminoacyl peptidase
MLIRALLLAALVLAVPHARGQALPTAEDFARLPQYANPQSSRNGRFLAAQVPHNGRMNLAVIDLQERTQVVLTDEREFDVIDIVWVGNDRLLYRLGRLDSPLGAGAFDGGGLFMVSRDGRERVTLLETARAARLAGRRADRSLTYVRALPGTDSGVLALGNLRDPAGYDLYRLDVTSGRTELLTPKRPERTERYVLDRNRVPRIAQVRERESLQVVLHYRRDERAPWQEMARFDLDRPGALVPLFFAADNRTLVVATNAGRDTMAIYRYDPEARRLMEAVFEHAQVDAGADPLGDTSTAAAVLIDPVTDEVLGHTTFVERPQTTRTTEAGRRLQRTVDRALPDTYNRAAALRGNQYLVTAQSDRWPTTWHILDEAKGTIEDLLASHPWLPAASLAQVRPFVLTTRDGLRIPSLYVLPRGRAADQRLPTVVHVHDGPLARPDRWGALTFGVREAQLLAAHGYAVVLPNFRGTPGLGSRVFYAGFGALGRQMIDDIEDAARWAVEQGIADAARICVSGAGYGGYAALMALARPTPAFRCGIAGQPITDWPLHLTSAQGDTAERDRSGALWRALLGVERIEAIAADLSPVNLADRIRQPVLIYAGSEDRRVPVEQTARLVEALERAGRRPHAVIVKPDGYALTGAGSRAEVYAQMLKFLEAHLGARK